MERMSAKIVGGKIGKSAAWVYDQWKNMGLVMKDKFGDWALTEAGRNIGGRMSKNSYRPVPTFDFPVVKKMMDDFNK